MANVSLNFKLELAKSPSFQTLVCKAMADKLNRLIPRKTLNIRKRILDVISEAFENSDTYDSLNGGELQQHFGLRPSEVIPKLNGILDIILRSTQVEFTPIRYTGGRFSGGIKIFAIASDFQDLFSDESSEVVTNKKQTLPWLQWLLIEGDKIVIAGYEIAFGPYPTSRAGDAIMIENPIGIWRVPPEYSGTATNNWLTKLFSQSNLIKYQITTILVEELSRI